MANILKSGSIMAREDGINGATLRRWANGVFGK